MQVEMRNSGMTSYRYRSPQELHLLSILAQTVSRQVSGCLQIADGTQTWVLFLERGKLVFASSSVDPFGRLDRHLKRLNSYIPTLASPVRVQVRLLFENPIEDPHKPCQDYEAICWLVEQRYLTEPQAAELIKLLAKEVMETLLPVQQGNHAFTEKDLLGEMPRFCELDLRLLVESCQVRQPRRPPAPATPAAKSPIQPLRVPPPPLPPNPALRAASPPQPTEARPPAMVNSMLLSDGRSPTVSSKAGYTVACIDDSPTVLSAIEAFLDDNAFTVIRIENPISALMTIIRNKPDLILLDVTMPNLDGYELCSLLRRHPSFRTTPIIMVTGNRGLIDRAKAKLVGASGYLTKPFTQPDLLKIVFKHLT
jgi:chemotaxis family two-component system response regulator PixG